MSRGTTYYSTDTDLSKVLAEHPEYFKIYRNEVEKDNKIIISLSLNEGQILYCVSDAKYTNLKEYLIKREKAVPIQKRPIEAPNNSTISDTNKKAKQQNLMSFFKKI